MQPRPERRVFEDLARLRDASQSERQQILATIEAYDRDYAAELRELLAGVLDEAQPTPWKLERVDMDLEGPSQLVGRTFDSFLIEREIGRGGMGRVYAARQEWPARTVALKVVRRALATPEVSRRFRHEAEMLSRLNHPNIAAVFGAGFLQVDGESIPYFAMEYIDSARPIDVDARDRRLDLPARLRLFVAVCDAVAHGHQRGIVHRDLKPANVLVGADGRPRLIDFGVAKALRSDVALSTMHTMKGELLGTLPYMSPEQLDGDDERIDTLSDVYGLGATLYELIAGRPPIATDRTTLAKSIEQARSATPSPPSTYATQPVPRDVDTIAMKAIEKRRERRYGTASELAADVRRFLAGEPILARAPTRLERAARWTTKHPIALTVAVCLLVVATSALTSIGIQVRANEPERVVVDGTRRTVALLTRGGKRSHTWSAGLDGGIVDARLLLDDSAEGTRATVVIAYGEATIPRERAGQVEAHLGGSDVALWSTRGGTLDPLPPGNFARDEAIFVPTVLLADDVFPERPGTEVAFAHRLSIYSETAVRVFGADGTELYRIWIDGAPASMVWLSGPRRLVLTGGHSEARWDSLGVDQKGARSVYPIYLVALEPRLGHIAGDWIVRDGQQLDPTLSWFRWFGPAESLHHLGFTIADATQRVGALDPQNHVCVSIHATIEDGVFPADLLYFVDGDGRCVRSVAADTYKVWQNRAALPTYDTFGWLDLRDLPKREPGSR